MLDVYETGQYPVSTPQRPLIGSIQQSFYGGQIREVIAERRRYLEIQA